MFFHGTLNAAVAAALQSGKYVVCFHSDNLAESQTWENDYLPDDSIQTYIKDRSVVLKLIKDSEEAGFLSQIVPIPKTPTLVIIHNANIKGYIPAGVGKAEFLRRVTQAFVSSQRSAMRTQPAPAESLGSNDAAIPPEPNTLPMANDNTPPADSQLSAYDAAAAEREAAQVRTAAEPSVAESAIQEPEEEARRAEEAEQRRLVEEAAEAARRERRAAELAQHQREEAEAQRSQIAREEGEARRKAAAEEAKRLRKEQGPHKPHLTPDEQRHRDEVAKAKAEKEAERKRILTAIEDGRAERRSREEARRQAREDLKAREAEKAATAAAAKADKPAILGLQSADGSFCAVQVRLFDGRTVRAKFGPESTLKEHVRPWVSEKVVEQGVAHVPGYSFKMILTPLPNRTLSPKDDEPKTLRELKMMPSVTLVLVETKTGYPGTARPSFTWPSNLLYTVLWRIWDFVFRLLGLRFLLTGPTATGSADTDGSQRDRDGSEKGQKPSRATASGLDRANDTVRRKREQQQYYNGNSVNFESPPDDDEQGQK